MSSKEPRGRRPAGLQEDSKPDGGALWGSLGAWGRHALQGHWSLFGGGGVARWSLLLPCLGQVCMWPFYKMSISLIKQQAHSWAAELGLRADHLRRELALTFLQLGRCALGRRREWLPMCGSLRYIQGKINQSSINQATRSMFTMASQWLIVKNSYLS